MISDLKMYSHLDLGALFHVVLLRNRVGHHDRIEARVVDFADRIAAEYAMGADGVDLLGARLLQLLLGQAERAARVGHVVDEDGDAVLHVAHQHHRLHFVRSHSLFVDERKVHVQSVGYRCHSFHLFATNPLIHPPSS